MDPIPNVTLTLVDGVKVVVPDSLDLITSYVVHEQEDWFEDEIKFLRRLIQPGQRVIDIGANYGLYSLVAADRVGPGGRVWAFEPASGTAKCLASSAAANDFGNVVVDQSAVSDTAGSARLTLNDNAELNRILEDAPFDGEVETVPLVTLDQSMEKHGWNGIDFLKIDAEGHEVNILRGGRRFFDSESPLIQYEVTDADGLHMGLVKEFSELGYRSYRLVPGLDVLVPFGEEEVPDDYLLNLFCCKPDRAARLAARGLLIEADSPGDARSAAASPPLLDDQSAYGWREALAKLPYGKMFSELWEKPTSDALASDVLASLALYARSQDDSLSCLERFEALRTSFCNFQRLVQTPSAYLRPSSLARIARAYGARGVAVKALGQLCDMIFRQRQANPAEPFLPPGERFDALQVPSSSFGTWLAAATLEELERNQFFSSYYSGTREIKRLEIICNSGLGSEEMTRRRELVCRRFGIPMNR